MRISNTSLVEVPNGVVLTVTYRIPNVESIRDIDAELRKLAKSFGAQERDSTLALGMRGVSFGFSTAELADRFKAAVLELEIALPEPTPISTDAAALR